MERVITEEMIDVAYAAALKVFPDEKHKFTRAVMGYIISMNCDCCGIEKSGNFSHGRRGVFPTCNQCLQMRRIFYKFYDEMSVLTADKRTETEMLCYMYQFNNDEDLKFLLFLHYAKVKGLIVDRITVEEFDQICNMVCESCDTKPAEGARVMGKKWIPCCKRCNQLFVIG
jgi:hypothetical protein